MEKALIEILNAFDYEKYDVTLWLRNKSGEWTSLVNDNVTIRCWGDEDSRELFGRQFRNRQYATVIRSLYNKLKCRYWKNRWDMNEFYATKSLPTLNAAYDCVIAYQVMSTAVVANALYRLQSNKKILWVHGRNLRQPEKNLFWDNIYNKFDLVYCVSKGCQKEFVRDFPKTGTKSQVFYNLLNKEGIECKAAMPVKDMPLLQHESILVTVGRLEPIKGQLLIPEVAQLLAKDGYQFRWYLIGDGSIRGELERKVKELGVQNQVVLLGIKDNPYPYIKRCDIYVQTSYSEGYCTTTVEAKLLCKPVVTTNVSGMSEQFISGENGLIVNDTSSISLFNGIKSLLERPELRIQFKSELQKEKYSLVTEM